MKPTLHNTQNNLASQSDLRVQPAVVATNGAGWRSGSSVLLMMTATLTIRVNAKLL